MKLQPLVMLVALFASGCCEVSNRLSTEQKIEGLYPSLTGSFSGEPVAESPDPLVAYRWADPKASDHLESYVLAPASISVDDPSVVQWDAKDSLPIRVTGPCNLMFDFGQVNAGWLEFDAENLDGEVEMSISEYTEPAILNIGAQNPRKTAHPVRYGNTYRLELNKELYEGARFGWIHVKSLTQPVTISDVRMVCQIKPTNYNGSFACSDPTLTRIWYTGAYTVKLNLLKEYFGAILMERSDRHSWTGDAHPSQAASMVAFGNFDFVKQNLFYNSTQFNGIASYSLYWVLSLIDYYNYTGDVATLDTLTDNACNKLEIAYKHFGKNPDLQFFGWDERLGPGFENPNCTESQHAYQMLSIRVWNLFSGAMQARGRMDLAAKYRTYAQQKSQELMQQPDWFASFGLFAAADAVNTGLVPETECDAVWNTAFADRQQRLSYSPFNQYFVIQAMASMGRYAEALTTIDDCWGGQLRYGATTFFEVYRPSWNEALSKNGAPVNNQCGYTSFTHPWSAGATKWLTEEILGVKPVTPGFVSFNVTPHLSAKVTSVKGSVPTQHGTIRTAFDIQTGEGSLSIPEGTTAMWGIPKSGRAIAGIKINGEERAADRQDEQFVYLEGLASGDYDLHVAYTGSLAPVVEEPFTYTYTQPAVQDSTTQGNWKGTYGNRGYILFNYDGLGKDRVSLPEFTQNVTYNKRGDMECTVDAADCRALVSDREGDTQRNIGAVVTRDPAPCDQTLTVDICNKEAGAYRVALYFVDWDRNGRRSAIEVFDLNDKKLLMPVQVVQAYGEGKYVILNLDRSVRLRIDQIRGTNASFSALFFD